MTEGKRPEPDRTQVTGPKHGPEGKRASDKARPPARMSPEERREMILDGAVHFFAKHGFRAQTRALSKELNVSQALIFRYFGSKEELVEAVYQRNFLSRWRDEWEARLRDRSQPLNDRLVDFYMAYVKAIDDHDWIRISVFSGLSGNALTKRYIETHVEGVLTIIAEEVQREVERTGRPALPGDHVHELVWHLHSTFIYYLFRKHVFRTRATRDHRVLVTIAVDSFLLGLSHAPQAT